MVEVKEHIRLQLTRTDEMVFKIHPDNGNYDIIIDKMHHESEERLGGTPSRLLASALLGCLTSSLINCVRKRDIDIDDIESIAEFDMIKDDRGFVRIKQINVSISTKSDSPAVNKRINICKKFFEEQCTVTAALREGIKVNVSYDHDENRI